MSSEPAPTAHTTVTQPPRIAILTISDGVSSGRRTDVSGAAITAWIDGRAATLIAHDTVPDDAAAIVPALLVLADRADVDVILTTGGTGLTARDVTPEATRAVIDRDVPGIPERLRAVGTDHTPYAAISRGIAGTRGSTLIVNLPGSPGGVRDGLAVLADIIDHAVQLLRGADTEVHDPSHG